MTLKESGVAEVMAPSLAPTCSGPTSDPVTVSFAIPELAVKVPSPVTAPAPPTSAKVTPELKEVTVLPHASCTVALTTHVLCHFTPEEHPETVIALAGPKVVGAKVVLTAEVRFGAVATNW